jgi:hypothetical protein
MSSITRFFIKKVLIASACLSSVSCGKVERQIFISSNLELQKETSVLFNSENGFFSFKIKRNDDPYSGLNPIGWSSFKEKDFKLTKETCKKEIQKNLSGIISQKPEIELNSIDLFVFGKDTVGIIDPQVSLKKTKLRKIIKFNDGILTVRKEQGLVYVLSGNKIFSIDENLEKKLIHESSEKVEDFNVFREKILISLIGSVKVINKNEKTIVSIKKRRGDLVTFGETNFLSVENNKIVKINHYGKRENIGSTERVLSVKYIKSLDEYMILSARGVHVTNKDKIKKIDVTFDSEQKNNSAFEDDEKNYVYIESSIGSGESELLILDTSTLSIVGKVKGLGKIVEFSRTEDFIYLREENSNYFVLLRRLNKNKADLSPVRIQAGINPLNSEKGSNSFSPIPGEGAMFVLNEKDSKIYYYKEGLMAPLGSNPSYGIELLNGVVLRKEIKETNPGEYRARVVIPKSGAYLTSFILKDQGAYFCALSDLHSNNIEKEEEKMGELIPGFNSKNPLKKNVKNKLLFKFSGNFEAPPRIRAHVFRIPTGERESLILLKNNSGEYQLEYTPTVNGHYSVIFEHNGIILNKNSSFGLKVF